MPEPKFKELKPKVVLGVGAHPDDMDFSSSGSFAIWAAKGAEAYYLVLTDGSKGSDNLDMSSAELIKTRQDEQRAAAKILGLKDVFFLGYPDAYLEPTLELKKDITRVIRKLKPDTVVTMDPSVIYSVDNGFINHSDHRVAGQCTLDAVYPMARDRLTFPDLISEGYVPHKVKTVLLVSFNNHNFQVDITGSIDKKLEALAAHTSQINDVESIKKWIKQRASRNVEIDSAKYVESFVRLDLPF
ncbi:MAG TPA: PIG-L deacetylase family protein [Candidatus Saccharimonadales bacterium]|nr:PIG-L deacetylase family protein [Candidatus Saccharimonadales bacterium]